MKILVAYASRHGATTGIAERIHERLGERGHDVTLRQVAEVDEVSSYDAVVVGSAAYVGAWLKEAAEFVRRNQAVLADRPVWLFSSGPIGTETVDEKGRDVLEATIPREFAEFDPQIHPRDMKIFFGAFDPDAPPIGVLEHIGSLFTRMERVRQQMPAGDFRDWPAIDAWSDGIADQLTRDEAERGVPA